MKRIPYETMVKELKRVLVKKGFNEERGQAAAEIFAQNSLAGVYSHGLNRFPRVVSYLEKGEIDPDITATCELRLGALERWNGHRGFGPLNAKLAMDRACELAKEFGIGIVALGNNNHWMRGGIPWPICPHGEVWTGRSAIIPSFLPFPEATAAM